MRGLAYTQIHAHQQKCTGAALKAFSETLHGLYTNQTKYADANVQSCITWAEQLASQQQGAHCWLHSCCLDELAHCRALYGYKFGYVHSHLPPSHKDLQFVSVKRQSLRVCIHQSLHMLSPKERLCECMN